MDTSTELQASGITNASDAKPSDVSVDSGYETATMNPSTEIPESLPPESPRLLVEKENDSLSKGSGLQSPPMSTTEETPIKQDSIDISDTREKDDDVTSMEKRLIKLENELRELKSGNPPGAIPATDHDPPVASTEVDSDADREAKISRMTYKEFRQIKPDMKPAKTTAAIIVCYDDTDMHDITKRSKHVGTEKRELQVPREDAVPTHIAINSRILTDVIRPEIDFSLPEKQTIFIAPFKGIVAHEAAIRAAFERRAADCESEKAGMNRDSIDPASTDNVDERVTQTDDACSSARPVDGKDQDDTHKENQSGERSNAEIEPTDTSSQSSYEQKCTERDLLRCLIEVMDTDLRFIFELRRQLQDGRTYQGGIAYKDLWHLYKPGDIVVSNPAEHPGPQRAYSVLHVTGGRASYEKLHPTTPEPGTSTAVWSITDEVVKVSSSITPFVLDCVYIDYDGTKYGPRAKCVALQDYNGLRAIKFLELFPIRFSHEIRGDYASLVQRGKKYASLRGGVAKLYRGLTLEERVEKTVFDAAVEVTQRKEVNGEIILDQKAGIEYCESKPRYDMRFGGSIVEKASKMAFSEIEITGCGITGCSTCTDISVDVELDTNARLSFIRSTTLLRNATKDELTDDHYAVLTPRMYGYALQERKWHAFNIENVLDHEVDSNKLQDSSKSFEDLVLPSAHKVLLRALISNQTRQFQPASTTPTVDTSSTFGDSEDMSMDLVRGKGKGVIILLHGVPGVGKTSTAECVAFHLRRPLFPITCGDLGVDANTVESRLEEYFRLASQWGCVLLLDEADVFLARRSEDQLKRNALVSVFLRVLEYYSGVLMLTTNRVGSFDEAFRSRIHISLYYPKLGKKETTKIWEMNLRRIEEAKDVDVDIDEVGIREFYKKHWNANEKKTSRRWNGRQIKNAFQTALALANWDFHENTDSNLTRPKLKASHFKQVAKTSNHFDDYLAEVFREGEDQYADMFAMVAKRERLRNDTDRGHRASKQSRRRDRSSDSSSDSASSESEHTKRKQSKREKEKRARSKAKKSGLSDTASDGLLSDSENKTGSSDTESEKSRRKRKTPKKDTKKSKGKSKKEPRAEPRQADDSGSG